MVPLSVPLRRLIAAVFNWVRVVLGCAVLPVFNWVRVVLGFVVEKTKLNNVVGGYSICVGGSLEMMMMDGLIF